MCGIAGVLARQPIDRMPAILEGFSQRLQHRGPDDTGFATWNGRGFSAGRDARALAPGRLGLVHRRLSIVDLSERGWQPMADPTGDHVIVFNGEIYNYPELRDELASDGVRFRSSTDTEVLLHLLIRSGETALTRLVGMFAFAYCNARQNRLLLARDPFGIKPLFYAADERGLAFASEIRPLVDGGFSTRTVDPGALFDYLRSGITDHAETTPIAGIRQLPPAHVIETDLDTCETGVPRRYWTPSLSPRKRLTAEAAAEELRGLFTNNVRLHLRADVPVAATLSGGIDSSAIVGAIGSLCGTDSLAVFSYVADDPAISEERYVDLVATATGVRPRKIRLNADALADELDSLIVTQEQPFATTSIWAQNHVFRRVHDDGFKVVMDGQGADELFAGYPFFRAARIAGAVRHNRWREVVSLAGGSPDGGATPVLQALGTFLPAGVQQAVRRLLGKPVMPTWLNASWFEKHGAGALRRSVASGAGTDLVAELYDATTASSLPMLLRYADRNAMSYSLENRVPFLTTALAEFALSLPDCLLIGADGTMKRILRLALHGIVPEAVLDRRDKIGFVTPEARWFAGSTALRRRAGAVLDRPLPPCFSRDFVDHLRAAIDGRAAYSAAIWRGWNVVRWAQLMGLEFPA